MAVSNLHAIAILSSFVAAAMVAGPREAPGACRETAPGDAKVSVRWVMAEEGATALDAWCAAVGGAVLAGPRVSGASASSVAALAVVAWNVKGGAGELEILLRELRAGKLTAGRPVEHFSLLLQEAVRVGAPVPEAVGPGARSARPVGAPTDPSRSIQAVAARAGLFLFYAPSMRNGAKYREDRGNAILSTLPLFDPVAVELPYERQRRVAVSARVSIPSGDGEHTSLRLVSAHLDNTSRGTRFWRSFGAGRARQAHALLAALDGEEAVALGGDLNTWFGQSHEEAVVVLRGRFALPARLPDVATYSPPYGLPQRQTDYLLLRLPDPWEASYRVARDWRNSDHVPLVGWLERPTRDVADAREEQLR
ncbi:MAG: endonuclease/exonuclease/phosphatase family protein [Planctomycetota bacterium]|jgi:hypothetical protein